MKEQYANIIKNLSDRELIFHLYLTQLILLVLAFILGLIFFEDWAQFFHLFDWQDGRILWIGGGAGIAVVLMDLLVMRLLPKALYDDGGLNVRIFRSRNVFHIALIAAVVSFGEELLFRGVIQTHFGLIISSIIFALVHYRYLFHWFLFVSIITLSFVIGYIYQETENLFITIFMHFIIDFLLGVFIRFRYRNLEDNG